MEATLMGLIEMNTIYHHNHGVTEADVKKANELIKCIEETRDTEKPCAGDVIICKGPKKEYKNGHLEYWNTSTYSSICVQPYTPFVNMAKSMGDGDALPFFDSSGGYWFSVREEDSDMFELVKVKEKEFKAWGHCGPCGGGAFTFKARVNVWSIFKESIY